ncbi:toll/interleukin-1 receptor domain-containing protein [uncultured Psychrobacter sp.]|uniref:toll/interleukin-1 receptor domain-containing protein n=1 Tax=uncultured Psychrobacter sp. TaxID=259303 RepID=UPI002639FC52|nr:toll/interleukin-1 receptor domain-containing protein [uncultured Psychrobacter sp.]
MKNYCYQLIILGKDFAIKEAIISSLKSKVKEIGIDFSHFKIINDKNFGEYTDASPSFCIYLGRNEKNNNFSDVELLEKVVVDASLVLPIVQGSLDDFNQCVPSIISTYNGLAVSEQDKDVKVEKIVNNILEAFSLLRKNRRVFISYKRDESTSVAIQLYEALEKNGFDVFLDTHSIRPSEPFQDELWHRMADSDVVVLLNTSNFLESIWTTQELAMANKLLLGMVVVSWPEHSIKDHKDAEISFPIQLEANDFNDKNERLNDNIVDQIIKNVESIRARTLAARRDNLISNFVKIAKSNGYEPQLDSYKIISMSKDNEEIVLVPAVGIPNSLNYESSSTLIKEIKKKDYEYIYILFDETCIRDFWLKHLEWLDSSLTVETLSILRAQKWLTN